MKSNTLLKPGRGASPAKAASAGRIITCQPGAKSPRRFGRIEMPEFANVRDRELPIMGWDPGKGYEPGMVFFANEAEGAYHPGSYHEALSNILNGDPRTAIQFCNDSQFLEAYYSEALTNFTTGWRDPNNIEDTLQFICPAVPVGRRFEWKGATNAEEFLSELVDDQRAIGADFKVVRYTGTDVTDKTLNRGLSIIVDLDNVGSGIGGGVAAPWQTNAVNKLTRRLYRNSLRRGFAALSAAAVSVPVSWPVIADNPGVIPPNPDMDVKTDLVTQTNVTGVRNNRIIYGDTAALYRDACYGARNNPAGYAGYMGNGIEASLASALMVDRVKISRERYQSSGTAKSELLGAAIYTFFAQDGVDTEDPSNIKRFISRFDSEQGGGLFRVYVQQISSKLVKVTIEFYEKIVVTYSSGIRKLVVSNTQ